MSHPPAAADLLKVEDLCVEFKVSGTSVRVVHNVSFTVRPGETLGVVGESGSGKSVTALSLARLLPPNAHIPQGTITFAGADVLAMSPNEVRSLRGRRIGFIFQDPMSSLNPTQSIGRQVAEPARTHLGMSRKASLEHAADLLNRVGIPQPRQRMGDYPHQFSGGMRQRVMIAIAIACNPALLIADESTTALDVTMQAQILELIRSLSVEFETAVLMITHDLAVASTVCDRINVMYAGQIVESADTGDLFDRSQMPYTKALMRCIPSLEGDPDAPFVPISGLPPDPTEDMDGCRFRPRCEHARAECLTPPLLTPRQPRHLARCLGTQTGGWINA